MSTETENSGQELPDKELIGKFKKISTIAILQQYEANHREAISKASFAVKSAFDEQWMKVTGNSYYQPVTTVRPPETAFGKNNTERSDPRSRDYRTNIIFSIIYWQKIRRRFGKKMRDLYNLSGTVKETSNKRPIFQNLGVDRLKEILGEADTEKILAASGSKMNDHGEIKGSFDLRVEGYWMVQFSPMKSENDPVDVRLIWEGECLLIKRAQDVVLPGFYIEVANNATKDQYIQNEKVGRKKIGVIQEYPYTVFREATREEYLEQKAAGDKVMRDKLVQESGG